MIIIFRPYPLKQENQTSKPYAVESTDSLALTGLTDNASLQTVPFDTTHLGASVDKITLDIRAVDGSAEYDFGDGISISGGVAAASYTISAAYGSISGGKDAISLSGGVGTVSLTVTAGYVTYSREADAISLSGGVGAVSLTVTAGYVTYSREADAISLSGGVAAITLS